MNPAVLTSAISSILMILLGGIASKLGWDAATTNTIIGALAALIIALGIGVWRAAARSKIAIIAEAAKAIAPDGGVIMTTPEIADGKLKDIPNVVTKQ